MLKKFGRKSKIFSHSILWLSIITYSLLLIFSDAVALNKPYLNSEKKMKIKIIFDSNAIDNKFETGWGFSCLINNHILFDTGADGDALLNNLKLMHIKSLDIDKIVISHEHLDHTGGLWKIIEHQPNIAVYVCPNFNQAFKDKIKKFGNPIINAHAFQEIDNQIYATGEMSGSYKNNFIAEQALVLKTAQGLVIITGCAHPGIINIIKIVKSRFPQDNIYLVLGGFHLSGTSRKEIENITKEFQSLKVQKVAPLHCSGDMAKKIFKQYYGDNCISLDVGEKLEI